MDESEAISVKLEPDRETSIELTVAARATIDGRVIDSAGEPIAGARVSAWGWREESPRQTTTDPLGRFRIRGLPPGLVRVDAESEGRFAEGEVFARAGLPYAELTLSLATSGLSIRVQVNDTDAIPVEGANVRVVARGQAWLPARAPIERRAITSAAGDALVSGLVPGRYRVDVTAPGYAESSIEIAELAPPGADATVMLARQCTARVRVLPEKPAQLVTIAVIEPRSEEDRAFRSSKRLSGQTGALLPIEGLSGRVELYASTEGSLGQTATRAVDLCSAPDPIVLDLSPKRGGALEAEVLDADRRPIAGIEVIVSPGERDATTDARGRARIEGLGPGEYGARTREGRPTLFEIHGDETAQVTLHVDREGGEISGVVVSSARPVEGAAIRAGCGDSGQSRSLSDAPIVARTDASGSFSFAPKNGGVCLVRAEAPAHGISEPVTLRAGSLPGVLEIRSFASIEGRVVELATRKPVTPYTLTIRSVSRDGAVRAIYVADPQGRFRVEGLAAGTVSIAVTSEQGRAHTELAVEPGQVKRGIELAVFAEGLVRGRVVGPNGGIRGADVSVRRVSHTMHWGEPATDRLAQTLSLEDGRFDLVVPAGDLMRVLISAPGFYPWGSAPFTFDPSGRPTLLGDIVLEPRSNEAEKEGGIGIMFGADPHGVRIIQFMDDSPSREAGLEIGDVITAIDGTPAGRLPMVNWLVSLRGPPGTGVVLEIERGTSPRFSIQVIRRAIGLQALPDAP